MCAAIDMLASEHLFYGHSPPAGFLSDYTPPVRRKFQTRGYSAPCFPIVKPVQIHINMKTAPRSCIRMTNVTEKKKVVFADDKGLALEQIKVMTEPSHVPPYWALKIVSSPPVERKQEKKDTWEMKFMQPASDYLAFRKRIINQYVSLENVILKQECAVDGTVKVKNLDFSKEVLVRTSSDGWRTHEDTFCAFIESGPLGKNGVSLYDTFGFRLQLPVNSRRLDFCISFKCKGEEYWDNNEGKNYTVEKSSVKNSLESSCARIKYGNSWSDRTDDSGNTPYW